MQADITYGFEDFVEIEEVPEQRLVSERYVNERNLVVTRQTDHEQLQPLPAPGTRASKHTYAFTERPTEAFDPTISGERNTPMSPHVRPSPLQDMTPFDVYHVNTLRVEAEPWDAELIG